LLKSVPMGPQVSARGPAVAKDGPAARVLLLDCDADAHVSRQTYTFTVFIHTTRVCIIFNIIYC